MGTEMGADFYNKIYSSDEKYVKKYTSLTHFPVFQIALSYIKELRNPFVFEIGCGTGQFAQYLWNNWIREYTGIDFSSKAIEIARSISPQVFEVAEAKSYNIPGYFNTIVALEVLEHIENDLQLISCIPQGKVIIFSVPRFNDLAHVRIFKQKEDVLERYSKLIKIDDLMKYKHWYVAKGTRNGTHLTPACK